MNDKKLSQEEINTLILAASSGGEGALEEFIISEKKKEGFQDYDFSRPDKFNLENIKSLESIANNFARNFELDFSASLRLPIRFGLSKKASIEQQPYRNEYIEKLPLNMYVFSVVDLGHEELGKMLIELDLAMVRPIHQRLMGARDVYMDDSRKPLTEIERITMQEWVERLMLPKIEEAFSSIVDLDMSILNIESEPQSVQITAQQDMIVIITFEVTIDEKEATLRLCIPYLAIEPIINKLTTENVVDFKIASSTENEEGILESNLKLVKEKIDIELGKTKITVKELLALTEGDSLVLDNRINKDTVGYIANLPKFSCQIGKEDNKVAVRVTGFAKKEEFNNE